MNLPGPFLKPPGWGGDHCGSDLALSRSYPCQLAATSVSPTLAFPQDLRAEPPSAQPLWPKGVEGRAWPWLWLESRVGGLDMGPVLGSHLGLALTLLPMEGAGLGGAPLI